MTTYAIVFKKKKVKPKNVPGKPRNARKLKKIRKQKKKNARAKAQKSKLGKRVPVTKRRKMTIRVPRKLTISV